MKKIVPRDAKLIPDTAKLMFKGIIFDTYQWQQELFDGSYATFEMLRRPDTAITIGVVDDKIVVLHDEQPHRGMRIGFGGGRVDDGDASVLQAAKRETLEETGYAFKKWRLVRVTQPQSKIEWFLHLFVAWDVERIAERTLDAGEKGSVELLPFEKVKELVAQKTGFMGEVNMLIKDLHAAQDLIKLPEFTGKAVDR